MVMEILLAWFWLESSILHEDSLLILLSLYFL